MGDASVEGNAKSFPWTIVTDPKKVERSEWIRFVDGHRNGSAFHRPEMMDVYASTEGDSPVFVAAVAPSGSILGVVAGVLQRPLGGPFGVLSRRAVLWGAPLIQDDDQTLLATVLAVVNAMHAQTAV